MSDRSFSEPTWGWLAALGCAGAALTLVVTGWAGTGVTPDSVIYLSTGDSLAHGRGFTQYNGGPYVLFPPLLPTLLAPLIRIGLAPVDAARIVSAASFGMVIGCVGTLVGRATRRSVLTLLAAAATLAATPLLNVSLRAWSEPPFLAFSLLSLLAMQRYLAGEGGLRQLWPCAGWCALAVLTRFTGVPLLVALVVGVLTLARARLTQRIRDAASLVAVALAPVGGWLLFTHARAGTWTGERPTSAVPPRDAAYELADTVGGWMIGDWLPVYPRAAAVAVTLMVIVGAALVAERRRSARGERGRALLLLAGVGAWTAVYLIVTASTVAVDPLGERLAAPLLPPLIAAVVIGADGISVRWLRQVTLAAVALWLGVSAIGSGRVVSVALANGIDGYEAARWRHSQLAAAVREQPPSGMLISNDPFALWYLTRRTADLSPRAYPYRSPRTTVDDGDALAARLASGEPVTLLWFDGVPRDFLLPLDALGARFSLEPVAAFSDGTAYRMTQRRSVGWRATPYVPARPRRECLAARATGACPTCSRGRAALRAITR